MRSFEVRQERPEVICMRSYLIKPLFNHSLRNKETFKTVLLDLNELFRPVRVRYQDITCVVR